MCPDRDQHVATDGIKTITHNCPAALEFGAGHLIKATIHFHFRPFKKLPLRSASVARSSEIEMITQGRTGVILADKARIAQCRDQELGDVFHVVGRSEEPTSEIQ